MKTEKICRRDRIPFYDLAGKYLPSHEDAVVVDLGSGSGNFDDHLKLGQRYRKLFLLDGNGGTVDDLRKRYSNVILYNAPEKLPFEDMSVDYLHCSHMIEHLYHEDLYKLLAEIDRVLRRGGVLAVSAPMLWAQFYGDLTHVRPYHHEVLLHYLCGQDNVRSKEIVSDKYEVLDLAYRYTASGMGEDWESTFWLVDLMIRGFRMLGSVLRIRKCKKNAYTMVLRKHN